MGVEDKPQSQINLGVDPELVFILVALECHISNQSLSVFICKMGMIILCIVLQ